MVDDIWLFFSLRCHFEAIVGALTRVRAEILFAHARVHARRACPVEGGAYIGGPDEGGLTALSVVSLTVHYVVEGPKTRVGYLFINMNNVWHSHPAI